MLFCTILQHLQAHCITGAGNPLYCLLQKMETEEEMNRSSGIFIVFEGIDGAGKSTQVNLLSDALQRAGEWCVSSKEPTDGKWGRLLRESATIGRLSLQEEVDTFVKDRKEHIATLINPTLAEGGIVILDRYFYSTVAYQGARGLDVDTLDQSMRSFAPIPDVVLFIDIDSVDGLERIRIGRQESPNEFEKLDSLQAVREIFQKLAKREKEIVTIDGRQSAAQVHQDVADVLLGGVIKAKRCERSQQCGEVACPGRVDDKCRWWKIAQGFASD